MGFSAYSRLRFLVVMLMGLAWFGAVVFDNVDPTVIWSRTIIHRWGILHYLPWPEFWTVSLINSNSCSPLFCSIGALFAVFLGASATYVKDIYALPNLRSAVHYVITSMFQNSISSADDRRRRKKNQHQEKSISLKKSADPDLVTIQPGNVVMFRRLREPSNITLRETYFVEPFERIGQIANLRRQMGRER